MFKLSLTSSELRLKVIKGNGLEGLRKPPPPIYPRFPDDKENVSMVECEQKRKFKQIVVNKTIELSARWSQNSPLAVIIVTDICIIAHNTTKQIQNINCY